MSNQNPNEQQQTPTALAPSTGSENWRDACTMARTQRLNRELISLGIWAICRGTSPNNDETTLTMLERRVSGIRAGVNQAGWDAVSKSHSPNDKVSDAPDSAALNRR